MTRVRRAAAGALVAALGLLLVGTTTAHAVAYRYWSFWTWDGDSWAYSNTGPPGRVQHGDIIGWRFATQPDSSSAVAPRGSGSSLCADGVSVFIDYGSSNDAPPGERPPSPRAFCADDNDSDNGYRATEEHATLRVRSDGLVCGIDNYPEDECGQKVASEPSPTPSPRGSSGHEEPRDRDDRKNAAQPRSSTTAATSPRGEGSPSTTSPSTTVRPSSSAGARQDDAGTPSPTTTFALTEDAPNQSADDGGDVPLGPIIGGAAIVVLGTAAVWQHRRSTR